MYKRTDLYIYICSVNVLKFSDRKIHTNVVKNILNPARLIRNRSKCRLCMSNAFMLIVYMLHVKYDENSKKI